MRKSLLPLLVLAAGLGAACEASKSSNPLSPSVAGPIAGVNITAPQPVSPASNSEIAITDQPVTLTVRNATTNGVRPLSYVFEVASDAQFVQKVYSRASVPAGDGQTSNRLSDVLAAAGTYYWRARAEDGANTGNFTNSVAFVIYVPVVIQAPTPVQPIAGALVSSIRPTFIVQNAARTGPAGAIVYELYIAADASFTQPVYAGQFSEGQGQTSMTIEKDLPADTTLFWRVRAVDPKNQGAWSQILAFRTPAGGGSPSPTPTPTPNPGPAQASDMVNLSGAVLHNSPTDLANWPITTALQTVDIRPQGVLVEFSKKDGPGRWPDVRPPGWSGTLEYTLGMCLNIGGQWHCSATIEYWHGLAYGGGPPGEFAKNWFYDPIRWGPMSGHQPAVGETIGFFVCAGDCRNNLRGDLSPARERSNVVLVRMPDGNGATYRF